MTKHPVRLMRNFGLLFSANVAAQLLQFLALVHLARVLGPAAFGIWGLAQAWMLSLLRVGEMGLEVVGIRSIAVDAPAVREITGNVLVLRLILALLILTAVLGGMLGGIFPEESGTLVLLLSLALLPTAVTLEWVFEAHQRVGPVGVGRLLRGLAFAVPVVALVRGEDGLLTAAYLYGASVAVAALFSIVMASRAYPVLPPVFSRARAVELLREAAPVGGATMLSQYAMFAGTILAGYMVSPEEVGLYTAGHRPLVFIWAYGIVTSNRVILPHLSGLFSQSPQVFGEFVRKYIRLLSLVAVPLALVGVLAGGEIMTLVFGPEFRESGPVFSVLSVAIAVAVGRSVLEIGLIASRRQVIVLRGMIGLAAIMTAATFAGFLWGGIHGAAWGALLAESAYAVYLAAVFRSVTAREILRIVGKPSWAAVVLGAGVILAGLQSLGVAAAAVAVYGAFLVLTRQVSGRDLALLRGALSPRWRDPS